MSESFSFVERLKAKMSGSLAKEYRPPKKKEKSRHPVRPNRYDVQVWKDRARPTELVDKLITDLSMGDDYKGGKRPPLEPSPELVEALFFLLYKAVPRLEDPRNLERELYMIHKIAEELQKHPKLQDLHDFTAMDETMSIISVDAMGDVLREIIEKFPPPPPPPEKKPKSKKKKPKKPDIIIEVEGPPPPAGDTEEEEPEGEEPEGPTIGIKYTEPPEDEPEDGDGDGDGEPTDEESDEDDETDGDGDGDGDGDEDGDESNGGNGFSPYEADEDEAEADWREAYDKLIEDELDLDRLAHKAMEAAEKEVSELDGLRKGIGLEDGEWKLMSPEKRLEMAERLRTEEMRALSDIVGRMKRFALGVRSTRIINVPHEAYDVETGNDLRRILRAQYALLGHRHTKYEFYRRWFDKELLQYKMRGTEEVGKGPIVMCIDKSYSMQGRPFNWAMGVAEALRRFAAEEDRDIYVLFFGTNNDRIRFEFPKGQAPFEKILTFLGTVANGGTEFDGVLSEALEKATNYFDGEGKGKADIVFITDGCASPSEEWVKGFNDERERIGVRVYSVYIGGASDMRYQTRPIQLLESLSDVVIPVAELKPESVREVFERV